MSSQSSAAAGRWRLLGAVFFTSLVLLAGCHTQAKKLKTASAETLYTNGRKALVNNDFEYAIKQYEALTSRFPFTSQARQARLDLIYAYYRKGEKETAIDAADPPGDGAGWTVGHRGGQGREDVVVGIVGVDRARTVAVVLLDQVSGGVVG